MVTDSTKLERYKQQGSAALGASQQISSEDTKVHLCGHLLHLLLSVGHADKVTVMQGLNTVARGADLRVNLVPAPDRCMVIRRKVPSVGPWVGGWVQAVLALLFCQGECAGAADKRAAQAQHGRPAPVDVPLAAIAARGRRAELQALPAGAGNNLHEWHRSNIIARVACL